MIQENEFHREDLLFTIFCNFRINLQHWTKITSGCVNYEYVETKFCTWLTKKIFWKILAPGLFFAVEIPKITSASFFSNNPMRIRAPFSLKKSCSFECKKIMCKILHLLSLFVYYRYLFINEFERGKDKASF